MQELLRIYRQRAPKTLALVIDPITAAAIVLDSNNILR